MGRGLGGVQRRLLELIASSGTDGVTVPELRGRLYGWRPSRRGRQLPERPGRWVPALKDDRAVRRALATLVGRGAIERINERPHGWTRKRPRYRLRRTEDAE